MRNIWLVVGLSLACCLACSPDSKTEVDQATGAHVKRACRASNGVTPQFSVQAVRSDDGAIYKDVQPFANLSISRSPDKKLIEVYDRETCDTRIWEDQLNFDGINMAIDLESDWFSLIVKKGQNEIEYQIKTCATVELNNGVYTCNQEHQSESGTFSLVVN